VTTCTDGENGGWFRNTSNEVNFWGSFYRELLEEARKDSLVRPSFIKDYLDQHGAHGEVKVKTGAWNTGWHHGRDFLQWTGSQAQKDSLERVKAVSAEVHESLAEAAVRELGEQERRELEDAHWRLLRAETSCNFYWGEDWVNRCHADLDAAEATLSRFRAKKYSLDGDPGWHTP
jgi:hypothetical protein